jgi:sorting nexin-13
MLAALARSVRESLWPGGFPAETAPPRDEATKMRTRIGAKMALFASLPDELRRIIGSETSRAGLLVLFDMLQRPVLNRRLAIVALEGILATLFEDHKFPELFARLHARSPRVRNEWRNSQRRPEDLRR